MQHPQGIYTMSDDAIAHCIEALAAINVKATPAHFDTSVLKEV